MKPWRGFSVARRTVSSRLPATFTPVVVLLFAVWCVGPAQAHLMPAQQGSLKLIEQSAYMMLSLPASGFTGLDSDGDGRVSMVEFNQHREAMVRAIRSSVALTAEVGEVPMHGVLLSPVLSHQSDARGVEQVVVAARFELTRAQGQLSFRQGLYGNREEERSFKLRIVRARDNARWERALSPISPVATVDLGSGF